jgi:hypothetical protein
MQIELQKYYEKRFSMMASQGWKDLMEDLEEMKKAINDLGPVTTSDQLWFKKGELSLINWVLNLKKTSEEVYDDLVEEENATKNV